MKTFPVAALMSVVVTTPAFAGAGNPDNVAGTERTANAVQNVVAGNLFNLLSSRFSPVAGPASSLSWVDDRTMLASVGSGFAPAVQDGIWTPASGFDSVTADAWPPARANRRNTDIVHFAYRGVASALADSSAPAAAKGVSFWVNGGYNALKNDFVRTAYDGSTKSLALGGDVQVSSSLVAGLSGTYSRTELDTDFNQGGSTTDSYALMPYLQYTFNDWLSGDLSAGYAWNSTDMHRLVLGAAVTGQQDSGGAIAAANLNAQTWKGSWLLGGNVGLLYNHDKRSSFTESNGTVNIGSTSELWQGKLGGSVGYWMDGILPSFSLGYTYDVSRDPVVLPGGGAQPANDRSGLTAALSVVGYDAGGHKGLTVSFNASREFLRDQISNKGVSLNVRYAY